MQQHYLRIKSYLTRTKQCRMPSVDENKISWKNPQESVRGPLLYLSYTKGLSAVIDSLALLLTNNLLAVLRIKKCNLCTFCRHFYTNSLHLIRFIDNTLATKMKCKTYMYVQLLTVI